MSEFERFLNRLQALLDGEVSAPGSGPAQDATRPRPGDAISAELTRPARTTAVISLRDSPVVEAFRNELIDGLIRVDTANQLLKLVNEVIGRVKVRG